MDELRLPSAIENSQCVLVAGAGGGFDLYAGLPIYERLRSCSCQCLCASSSEGDKRQISEKYPFTQLLEIETFRDEVRHRRWESIPH
jgi:hypothetical protein